MAIQRTIVDVRMADGTEHADIVVNLQDQWAATSQQSRRKWNEKQAGFYAVYQAMTRLSLFVGNFDQWIAAVETMAEHEVPDELDPTQTAP